MECTVRVDYGDHPEEVSWKFIDALRKFGIEVESEEEEGCIIYNLNK